MSNKWQDEYVQYSPDEEIAPQKGNKSTSGGGICDKWGNNVSYRGGGKGGKSTVWIEITTKWIAEYLGLNIEYTRRLIRQKKFNPRDLDSICKYKESLNK